MKHILVYATDVNFEAAKEGLQALEHYVAYVKDTNKVHLKHTI